MSTGPAGHTTQSSQCTASHTIEAEQPLDPQMITNDSQMTPRPPLPSLVDDERSLADQNIRAGTPHPLIIPHPAVHRSRPC